MSSKSTKFIQFTMLSTLALASASVLADKPTASAAAMEVKGPTGGAVGEIVQIQGTVTAIDKAKRTVTLKGPEGKTATFAVGKEARNFDQVQVGDMVTIDHLEAFSLELEKAKGAKPGITVTEEVARAKPGEMPAGMAKRKVTIIGTVTAIDEKTQVVTVKGPEGNEVGIHVKDAAKLKNVKTGDLVKATYAEALAITVSRPAAKPDAMKK